MTQKLASESDSHDPFNGFREVANVSASHRLRLPFLFSDRLTLKMLTRSRMLRTASDK